MEFVCYTDWDQLPASADVLFDRGEAQSLFLSRRWLVNLAAHGLDPQDRLLLACVEEKGEVLALLPLRTRPDGTWHGLSTFYTSLFSVLLDDKRRKAICRCLARGLADRDFLSLRLEPIADEDQAIDELQDALEDLGFESQRLSYFVNWSQSVNPGGFAQYFAARPSALRNTITRKRRKLERETEANIRLYTADNLERAMRDYNAVYKASWKDGERFTAFVPALVHVAAEAGWLRLAIMSIDGQPAAGQIWFVVSGKASIFRLAYDERWQRYSPGSILTSYLMERVIDHDSVTSIDFLTGNERYKQDWMSNRKTRWRVVMNRRPKRIAKRPFLSRLLLRDT